MAEFKSETRDCYGLHWKDHPEDVVKRCKTEIPILRIINNLNIWSVDAVNQTSVFDNHYTYPNMLIKGENYHALKVLEFTHKGKISCIYIDPPYNTGNKDFSFNDIFVVKEDKDRHSKWLSLMEHRLPSARKLLSDTGVIFISIDDNEQAQLRLLCDRVFGEENFIANIIWDKRNAKGNTKTVSIRTEYILIYGKNKSSIDGLMVKKLAAKTMVTKASGLSEKEFQKWLKDQPFTDGEKAYRFIDKIGVYSSVSLAAPKKSKNLYNVIHPATGKPCKIPATGWRCKEEFMDDLAKKNLLIFGSNETKIPRRKYYLEQNMYQALPSVFEHAGNGITDLLQFNFESDIFDYPKPVALIKWLLSSLDKNAIILDFFAGTGTTGQAVLELNKEDGGNRQFILCTNDEGNIFTDICYPRLQKVIGGYKTPKGKVVEGIPANLVCFTCGQSKTGSSAFMKITKDTDPDTLKLERAQHSTGIIKTIEGTYIEESISYVKDLGDVEYVLLRNGGKKEHGNKYVGVYCTIYGDKLDELRVKMNAIKGNGVKKVLYYLTLEEEIPSSMLKNWDNVEIKLFPREFFDKFIK